MSARHRLPPFQRLLDREGPGLLAFLTATVGPWDAEDCFQETFLAAIRAYPDLRSASNLRGWLFTIAHRKAIDNRRQRQRRPVPAGQSDELAEMAASISRAVPEGRDGAAGTESGEIWAAVDELPPKQRAAVTLRFTADLTHREIGLATECSEAAARRNLHEGLKSLRKELT